MINQKYLFNLKQQPKDLLRGKHLLVVEDNEINMQVARELLEAVEIDVIPVFNGKEAVQKVYQEKFDAVLMDLQMPVMDGLSATREIRKNASSTELPIIAMTANAMTGEREKCINIGMNDHIAKPFSPSLLYSRLIHWLRPDISLDCSELSDKSGFDLEFLLNISICLPSIPPVARISSKAI